MFSSLQSREIVPEQRSSQILTPTYPIASSTEDDLDLNLEGMGKIPFH